MKAPCGHEGEHTGFGDFVTCRTKGCPGVALAVATPRVVVDGVDPLCKFYYPPGIYAGMTLTFSLQLPGFFVVAPAGWRTDGMYPIQGFFCIADGTEVGELVIYGRRLQK